MKDFSTLIEINMFSLVVLSVFILILLSVIGLIIKRKLNQSMKNFSLLFNQVNDAVFLFNLEKPYSIIEVNDVASELLGYTPDELKGMPITDLQGEPDIDRFSHNMETIKTEKKISFESTIRTRNNRKLIVDCRVSLFAHKNRTVALASIRDISKRKRLKNILRLKKEILEMIAKKDDLKPIFNRLIEMIEWHSSGAIASIMLADEQQQRLYHGASLKLPKDYVDAIEGLPIKDLSGTCGTAAYRKESVNIIDLLNDESCSEYRGLVEKYHLQACYSAPILSSSGTILGTFALYYDRNQPPVSEDIELLEIGCQLCALAIENKQMEAQLLQKTEEKYELIIENMSDMVILVNAKNGLIEYASPSVENVLCVNKNEIINHKPIEWVVQEDQTRIVEVRQRVLSNLQPEETELRLLTFKGSLVDVEAKYIPIKGEDGTAENLLIVGRDITERKKMQERMDTVKLDYFNAMKQQHGMTLKFIEQDGKFVYTFADGQLLYKLGFEPGDIVGKDVYEILSENPNLAHTINNAYRRAWAGEDNVSYEGYLAGITFLCTVKPIRKKGKMTEVIVSSIDISERKKMEAALLESEERHRLLFELSPDAIFIQTEGSSRILNANTAAVQLLDAKDVESLIGKIGYDYIPPEYRELVKEVFSSVELSEKKFLPEYQIISEKGVYKYVEAISTAIHYNGETVMQTVLRDISERKQAEEALRASEQKYRLIAENMHDIITVTDLTGKVVYVSPSYNIILGLQQIDSSFDFTSIVNEEDLHLFYESIRTVIEFGVPQQMETRLYHSEGHCLHFDVHVLPIFSDEGELLQILWVSRDITEKKKTEELLRKTDKMSIVGELAAGVAHEIKNPLTTLKGFVQLLEKNPVKLETFLPTMSEELDRINYITDEFLTLAKPQSMSFTLIKIDDLIMGALALVKTRFDHKQVEIKTIIESNVPSLFCSKQQIKQMLINILTNSYEAIEHQGEITIEVKAIGDNDVKICVKDNGRGIPSERIQRLGEPYYSINEKGTGIGLMVSYKIVQDHKGSITIMSDEGLGTTVQIILPASQQQSINHLEASVSQYNMLTSREKDVLSLIGKGKSNKEIAMELDISESTVKNHITKIFNKLGISDRSQAIVLLYQNDNSL